MAKMQKFGISTFFSCIAGQTWAYPQICIQIWHFCTIFWYFWLWTPITLARVDKMQIFFWPITKPLRWRFQEGKSFYHFDTFCLRSGPYRVATVTKIAVLSLCVKMSIQLRLSRRLRSSCNCTKLRITVYSFSILSPTESSSPSSTTSRGSGSSPRPPTPTYSPSTTSTEDREQGNVQFFRYMYHTFVNIIFS